MPNTSSGNHHHHHRAGSLRQSNKANKRSNASKRSQGRRGRVSSATTAGTTSTSTSNRNASMIVAQNRLNRRNQANQRRQNKRSAKVEELRRNELKIPRVIGVLNLGRTATTGQRLVERLCGGDAMHPKSVIHHGATRAVTADYPTFRSKATYITLKDENSILEALDMARVCDILLCVLEDTLPPPPECPSTFVIHDGDMMMGRNTANTNTTTTTTTTCRQHKFDPLIRDSADALLQALKAQGLPTPLTVLCHNERTDSGPMDDHDPDDDDDDDQDMMTIQTVKSVKSQRRHELHHHQELRKYIYRLAATEFGVKAKVAEVNLTTSEKDDNRSSSVQSLVRTLMTMKCKTASWITESPRSFMIVEETQYNVDGNKNGTNTLQVSGYIRGGILDINALFHIPHVGTFAAVWAKNGQGNVVTADPTLRESLDHFATPNALDGEQNLIGFNEEAECEMEEEAKPRPAGWSDYQNAWLDAIDDPENDDDDCDIDHGELADELNTKHSQLTNDDGQDMLMDDVDDENVAAGKTIVRTERRKQFQEDAKFPDEVQVPEDIPARDRFQRYRSLKNFRKTHWDPKENLPQTYANIYHFRNFAQTQKIVMKDMKELEKAAEAVGYQFFGKGVMITNKTGTTAAETKMNVENEEDKDEVEDDILVGCIPTGSYVTLCLDNVTTEDMKRLPKTGVLSVVSLLPHENKVSVLNVGLKHCNPGCDPVKSKDVLTFRCGWRTWTARPVFSQHNLNSDKHKLERFLPDQNIHICASLFGPVTYTPCPVLVFRGSPTNHNELVGMGSMLSASADRIVVKRILLTGYPVKVRKRTAIVKYMFYNPDDVKWFQPAGLYTKHGLNGHTIQSVGEHGTMKCLFNAPIHQHDTVCLPLYKRIFPKYVTDQDGQDTLEIR